MDGLVMKLGRGRRLTGIVLHDFDRVYDESAVAVQFHHRFYGFVRLVDETFDSVIVQLDGIVHVSPVYSIELRTNNNRGF